MDLRRGQDRRAREQGRWVLLCTISILILSIRLMNETIRSHTALPSSNKAGPKELTTLLMR